MSTTIVFANQKGGVGKTTCGREIGLCMASRGLRVLFIDSDPQGNLSKSLMDEDSLGNSGLFSALDTGTADPLPVDKKVDLLHGDSRLAALEKRLVGEIDAYVRLRDYLADERFTAYDFILVDTPPSLGVLTINALNAADHLLIPMRPALYTLQGTNDLVATIQKVRKGLNEDLEILGVIVNGFDSQPVITRQIKSEIDEGFGSLVFSTVLSQSVKIEEAIATRKGVVQLPAMAKTKTTQEIESIVDELLFRLEGRRP
jgi:chromosome partitioning protein